MVAVGPSENGSRHYATLAFFGEDLVVLSRSGDRRAKSAHDNNLTTFHKVRNFRSLVGCTIFSPLLLATGRLTGYIMPLKQFEMFEITVRNDVWILSAGGGGPRTPGGGC